MLSTTWPFHPLAFLHDAARCLAFIHQDGARLNRRKRLQASSVSQLVSQMLLGPENPAPRKESQAPELSFLIGLLERAGLIAVDGDRLSLTSQALDWLNLPPQTQIEQLRQTWWAVPALNARWLLPTSHQHPLDSYWQQVVLETCQWVARLPTDCRTCVAEVDSYLEGQGVMEPGGKASNLPRVRRARKWRTLAIGGFLLRFVLPVLGLIEIDEGREELLLRPTAEGAGWLRAALSTYLPLTAPPQAGEAAAETSVPAQELHFPPPGEPPVTVDDGLVVRVGLAAPAAYTFDVAHFARLLSPVPPARYRVTRRSVEQAATWGYRVTRVSFLLALFSKGRLLPAVVEQLIAWQEEMTVITYEPGYRLSVAAPEVMEVLRQREPFRRRSEPLAFNRAAWVSQAQAKNLFRYLRRLRYALAPADEVEPRSALWPSLHPTLPLISLLVLLRTYQHLCGLVPGLADLGLGELEQALEAALPPDEKAAAQRLLESHVALLAEASIKGGKTTKRRQDSLSSRLQAAIEKGAPLHITYADTQARLTRRGVHPLRLETRWGQEYLVARCELRQDERHFRLDRIVEVD